MSAIDTAEAAVPGTSAETSSSVPSAVPIKLLHDRVLVREDNDGRERKSMGGIVIPATAQVGRRLAWAYVVAVGPNVRSVEIGDRVLFEPEDRGEVDIQGVEYILLRERDIHAVAATRHTNAGTGLYL